MIRNKKDFNRFSLRSRKDLSLGVRSAALLLAGLVILAAAGCGGQDSPKPFVRPKPVVTFKPQEMADALHAVIAADREVYSKYFEQHRAAEESANRSSQLPIPAHLLRQASEAVQQKGAEFHYVLRSLWPINPKNGPETDKEKEGLKFVVDHPEANFYSEESLGGRLYFTAVYPDRAGAASCVDCHNQHKDSPKKNFKQGDIMGGMVVRVPLEF